MFTKTAFLGVFASVLVNTGGAMGICGNYFGDYELDVCTTQRIVGALNQRWQQANAQLPNGCETSFFQDLQILVQSGAFGVPLPTTQAELAASLETMCSDALGAAVAANTNGELVPWSSISDIDVNIIDYFKGDGFLNLETGNFQQDPEDFAPERFIYIGDDPRQNDHYPTTEESYQVGVDVNAFQTEVNEKAFLSDPLNFANKCENQAIMCCWHRDRQYFDDNGNCNFVNCVNKDPADNTNLCWTEDEFGDPTAYPGDRDEGDLHCHGLAWGSELESANDFARFNNLFYVSLFDHMYTRGYVESVTNNDLIANVQPMCGCVEEMNPVSRADCTEAVPSVTYRFSLTPTSAEIEPINETFSLEFQACQGAVFDPTLGPEDIQEERDLGLIQPKANDLSAFVFRLFLEGKMAESTMFKVYETLVGYEDPNNNENEAACAEAFQTKFGEPYQQ